MPTPPVVGPWVCVGRCQQGHRLRLVSCRAAGADRPSLPEVGAQYGVFGCRTVSGNRPQVCQPSVHPHCSWPATCRDPNADRSSACAPRPVRSLRILHPITSPECLLSGVSVGASTLGVCADQRECSEVWCPADVCELVCSCAGTGSCTSSTSACPCCLGPSSASRSSPRTRTVSRGWWHTSPSSMDARNET